MTSIVVIIIIIALAGAFFLLKAKSGPDKASDKDTKMPAESARLSPETEFKKILNTLLKVNILIRSDSRLDAEVMKSIESIIDDLKVTVPSMMERYPGETLTYELKKIGSSHLYNNVKEFLDLSGESRANQISIFKNTLSSLNQISARARDIVEKNETQEFKTMANFLKTKFQTDIES